MVGLIVAGVNRPSHSEQPLGLPSGPLRSIVVADHVESELPAVAMAEPVIEGEDRYLPGEPIILSCRFDAPEGSKTKRLWKFPPGCTARVVNANKTAYLWASLADDGSGWSREVRCIVAVSAPGADLEVFEPTFQLNYGPPEPEPPAPPLVDLVDKETGAALADLCRRSQNSHVLDICKDSASEFVNGFVLWAETYAERNLIDNKAWPIIVERVTRAAGQNDVLDRVALVAELKLIVAELGGEPTPDKPTDPVQPVDPDSTQVSFDGFAVLVLEASEQPLFTLRNAMQSAAVQEYLAGTTTIAGAQGWRLWDATPDVPEATYLKNAPAEFKELWAVKRPGVPCVVVADKGRAKAFAWDFADGQAFIDFLKKQRGQ